jgi:hypothetical protein
MSFRKINKLSSEIQKKLQQEKKELLECLRGSDGVNGKDGATGQRGIQGIQGPKGLQGIDGRNGINGRDGKDGIDGKDGKDGIDGKGIKTAWIKQGYLYLRYTDETEIKVGYVVGPAGPRGASGSYLAGNTTVKNTNITEEVLEADDKANLASIATIIARIETEQKEAAEKTDNELRLIKTHLAEMTGDDIKIEDIEE